MDNRIISIQSEGRAAFDLAVQLLFDNCPGKKATHYYEHPTAGFILLWHEDTFESAVKGESAKTKDGFPGVHLADCKCSYCLRVPANKLPYPMAWKEAADLAWGWLLNQPKEKYQEYLDHDGSNGKGFRVYNEDWGHVAKSHYAFLGVLPVWAWYGK